MHESADRESARRQRRHLPDRGPAAASTSIEGLEILDEVPGEPGLLLMSTLRSLTLWGRVASGERAGLYLEGSYQKRLREIREAGLPADLRLPLVVLAALLDASDEVDPAVLATACLQLSEWAGAEGRLATACHFLRAAALADRGHPALPVLAHDLAYLWLTGGHHSAALRVFEAVRPLLFEGSHTRLYLHANIARAAGGCGRAAAFAAARTECLKLCRALGEPPGAAAALLEVAHGAAALGDADGAVALSERSAALALLHREEEVTQLAGAFQPGSDAGGPPAASGAAAAMETRARELSDALAGCLPLRLG
jgi:hypothetical protein